MVGLGGILILYQYQRDMRLVIRVSSYPDMIELLSFPGFKNCIAGKGYHFWDYQTGLAVLYLLSYYIHIYDDYL